MTILLQQLADGLAKGAVYALLALGLVIVYKASGVVNFAHGSLVLVGGFAVYELKGMVGWPAAAGLGVLAAALAGLLVERLFLANARRADRRGLALLTIGLDVITTEEIVRRVGAEIPSIGDPYDAQPIQLGVFTVVRTQALALAVGAVLIALVLLVNRYSSWGVAMRARSENREAAALTGMRGGRVTAIAWLLAGALAGVAVLMLATQDFAGAGPSYGTHAIALLAFPAAVIGGLDSAVGAVVGGLVVGVTEALSAQYVSAGFAESAVFLVMLLVLIMRPSGLLGPREFGRV